MSHANIELETQVIGALIRGGEEGDRNLVFQTDAILRTSEVFSTEGSAIRRLTYDAIREVAREGAPPSRHTVTERLRRERVPGVEFVGEAADSATLRNRDAYMMALDALVEAYQARRVARLLEDSRRKIDAGESSTDVATGLSRELLRVTDRQARDGGTLGDLAREYESSLRDLTEKPESLWWMRWGIEAVDLRLGAQIRGGQFVGVGAHTGAGKSVTMVDLIRANGVHGDLHPIGISLEMPSRDIFDRLLSSVSSVPYEQIRDRKITPEYLDRYHTGLDTLRDKRSDAAWVEHIPWAHLRDVEAKIRNVHATHGAKVVILDYVQLIRTERNHSRELEVTEAVRTLKMLASELDIVVVGLYQLNDEMMGRNGDNRRPRSSDARESKNIHKDADVSVVIDNPGTRGDSLFWDSERAIHQGDSGRLYHLARLDFDKVRRGKKGYETVLWDGEHQRFTDVPDHIQITKPDPMATINRLAAAGVLDEAF